MENINNWICSYCSYENSARSLLCTNCGDFKPESEGARLLRELKHQENNQVDEAYKNTEEEVLHKKGITDIDKSYLAIDYSKKTELVNNYGHTIVRTRPYIELLQFVEKTLTEELP